ncbi:MAG: hypothetical protein L0Z50_41400 [Verrucomicrobiales bacterium]|nr:hypothetical protein [Verrucomicrobiales bacterium]
MREDDEWREAHAQDAVHLSRGVIEFEIQDHAPDLSSPIILYCGDGRRSALVADNLQKMGYNNVLTVAGGFEAWQAAGLPTRSEPQPSASSDATQGQAPS